MNRKPKTAGGLTLVEVLLVIVLLTALAVAGISMYHLRIRSFQVDKATLQMEQWLQAAQAFYVDNAHWPVTETELSDYLPTASATNPWGLPYQIDREQAADGKRFRLITAIPAAADTNGTMVSRVAAHLPNATALKEQHQVFTEITVPGAGAGAANAQRIVSVQNIKTPYNPKATDTPPLTLPTEQQCPRASHNVHVYYAIANAEFNVSKKVTHLLRWIKGLPEDWGNAANTLQPRLESMAMITHSLEQEGRDPENLKHIDKNKQFANQDGALLAIVVCEAKADNQPQREVNGRSKSFFIF